MKPALVLALSGLLLAACGDDGASLFPAKPLASDGVHLRDDHGRVALLRGINARVRGVFDVTFTDGRTALETIPELTTADCMRMRELGFDLLRLPIQWSGIEPAQGQIDEAYLQRVDDAIACAAAADMFVVVDLHQDAYSKEIGEDGAPLWAIQPPPSQLLEGPLMDLSARRVSADVQSAFRTFFDVNDASGLQAAFTRMLGVVATRWANHPSVIGFELFNEPDTGTAELDAFHARAAAAIRTAAPTKLVMFEPPALRNFTDFIPVPKQPFPITGGVYAPHIYTFVFSPDQTKFQTASFDDLEPSVRAAREEATLLGTPLWIGEFGVGPEATPQNELWMHAEAVLHDRYFASNAFWVWKEQSQGSWGLFDHDDATDTWTERPDVVARVSRIHAARVAGTPTRVESSEQGDMLTVEVEPGSQTDAPHEIYVPERFVNARATCDGTAVATTRNSTTGLIEVSCSGTVEIRQ